MAMVEDDLSLVENGHVLVATLSRPAKLNAINASILSGLKNAVVRMSASPDLRVLLIRATGRYFSAGVDMTAFKPPAESGSSSATFRRWYRSELGGMHDLFDALEALEKPIVVAHQGPCLGAGLEMSLSCDFRLAASSARYRLPEASMGTVPGSGGLSRLVRLVGPHWARLLIMAGEEVNAHDARMMGFVHHVFDDENFDSAVNTFCERLASMGPEVTSMGKLAIELAKDVNAAQARNVERLANSALLLGDEANELLQRARSKLGPTPRD
jgi:enoyl-CoA hydratase